MNDVELAIDDDHPLALELSSLRTAVARFQHEAHTSALKLQRHSLEATMAIERAQALEHENAATRVELAALRAHPDSTPHPAELQLPELTLALRRASDKLTLAEDALRGRTAQFVDMQGAASRAHHAAENAFGVAAGARAREEEALVRERELMLQLRVTEEEGRMMDRAVREYADLVRSLERRQSLSSSPPLPSSPPPPTPPPKQASASDGAHTSNGKLPEPGRNGRSALESVQERKEGLHRLAGEFEGTNKALNDEIGRLQVELDGARSELEAERNAAEEERLRLSNALAELERLKHDDNAAAKMVSRYMKFSQATTDTLQRALESLNARHAATISTLHTQLVSAQAALTNEQRQSARLRDVLDEATEELAREAYGRRREIALRLAVVGREDQLAEALRRWVRRSQETCAKEDLPIAQRLNTVVRDACELLSLIDGAASREDMNVTLDPGIGSLGRIVAARDAARTLVEELQIETERRMQLERVLGRSELDEDGRVILPEPHLPHTPSSTIKPTTVATEATSEVVKVDAATSPICLSPSQVIQVKDIPSAPLDPPPVELPVLFPQTKSAPLEHTPTTVAALHQPTPRSSIGSPAFLSPHSSPSSLSASIPVNNDSISAPLPQDTTTLAPSTTNGTNTPRSPSSPDSPGSLSCSQNYSKSGLLTELENTKARYDELQRAFRDCHLALRELGQTLQAVSPSTSSLPTFALQAILSRLDDFSEDARVELEIRIADEERVARGYATLLAVPGAIASVAEAQDVEGAVRAFIEGRDATVARAQSLFARKRDDLEHDIAALKRTVHELPHAPSSPSPSSRPTTPVTTNTPTSWTSIAAGLFVSGTSSRPASPSPTFGAVVTSTRTRRAVSYDTTGPLATLQHQLRIPMPELQYHHHQAAISPSPVRPGSRARKTSGMYMLGLGMRGGVIVPGERPAQKSAGLATDVQEAEDFEVE